MKTDIDLDKSVPPRYKDYCISNLVNSILLTYGIKPHGPPLPKKIHEEIKGYEKIVVLIIDGLNYDTLRSCIYSKDTLPHYMIAEKGHLYPITTVFPSTTASALTTFHTGLTPQEHGIPEWCVYFKNLDMLFEALPFKPAREEDRERFQRIKPKPKELFKWETVYQKLRRKGIKSYTFTKRKYMGEGYAKEALKGSRIIGYVGLSDLAVNLRKLLERLEDSFYIWVYWNLLDPISHTYGILTEEVMTELSLIFYVLKAVVIDKVKRILKDTILVLTSDHGHIHVDPSNTIYLSSFPKVRNNIRLGRGGRRILPGGGPRDLFLYIKKERVNDVMSFLLERLEGKASVIRSEEALRQGLFGRGRVEEEFKERIGDILVLPFNNYLVWYRRKRGDNLSDPGYHGGLSREEMLIPLLIIDPSFLS